MPGKPVYLEPMANEFYAIQGDRRYFIAITYQHGLACILKEDKILSIGQNAGGHGSGCTTEQLNIGILQNRAMPHFSTCEELPLVDIMISDDIWHLDVMRIGLNQGRVWQRFYYLEVIKDCFGGLPCRKLAIKSVRKGPLKMLLECKR